MRAIGNYGFERFGLDRALAYVDEIEEHLQQLIESPRIGREEQLLGRGLRSFLCGSHRIFYTIEGDELVIQRILHSAMDAGRWLG